MWRRWTLPMPRDPTIPPPRPSYLTPDQLARAYADAAKLSGPHSPAAYRAASLATEVAGHAHRTGEPDSAIRARSDESGEGPDSGGWPPDAPANFR